MSRQVAGSHGPWRPVFAAVQGISDLPEPNSGVSCTADRLQWRLRPRGATMVLAWINFRAQPHKRPEILSAVDEMVERMRNSAGCERGRLYADTEDPNAFTVISEWRS